MKIKQYPEPILPECPSREVLKGQKALVTGAASGIGKAVALTFGQAGADVVVNYLKEEGPAQEVAGKIAAQGQDPRHKKAAEDPSIKILDAGYDAGEAFQNTVAYWRKWVSGIRYSGRWREMVHRSAMALKLLTFAPTGAIVAAPTTSLPETLEGARNFDYHHTWIREAAFTHLSLMSAAYNLDLVLDKSGL